MGLVEGCLLVLCCGEAGRITARRALGGLHHEYERMDVRPVKKRVKCRHSTS